MRGVGRFLREDRVDQREHHLPLPSIRAGQGVAHEVHLASLPVALSTFAAAAFSSLWASEITSFTPRSPGRVKVRHLPCRI